VETDVGVTVVRKRPVLPKADCLSTSKPEVVTGETEPA